MQSPTIYFMRYRIYFPDCHHKNKDVLAHGNAPKYDNCCMSCIDDVVVTAKPQSQNHSIPLTFQEIYVTLLKNCSFGLTAIFGRIIFLLGVDLAWGE